MDDWNPQANDIFLEALDLPEGDERGRFIKTKCHDNAALLEKVEALISAYRQSGEFLNHPLTGPGLKPSPAIGSMVGPYKLIEEIGEGGFGIVYLAEQAHPIRRRVALKILKA